MNRRRLLFLGFALMLLLAAIALIGRYLWLPNYRPDIDATERYGIDVSNHQGRIDWQRVAGDDIAFAYIKATEGGDFVDASFETNWEGAKAAALDYGAYHFFTFCRPAAEQAANFLRTVPRDTASMPPALDLELAGNCAERPDRETMKNEVQVFIERVEAATGQPMVLYIGDDFENHYRLESVFNRQGWKLSPFRRPLANDVRIWQVHGYASVAGIEGSVDLDVMSFGPG